ncbi:MAG: hypothetical protein ABI460_16575, partial [Caldimonas sp.]
VDGVSTIDALIEQLATDPAKFATRRKARIGSARSGPASERSTVKLPPTKTQMAEEAKAHAKAHGVDFVTSFKALGFESMTPATEATAAPARDAIVIDPERQAAVAKAKAHAERTGVDFAVALRELGLDGPSARQRAAADSDRARLAAGKAAVAEAKAYAEQKGVSFVDALKATGAVA